MNRVWIAVAAALVVAVSLAAQQASVSLPSGAVTSCPPPASGQNIVCSVTDGPYVSVNGAAYVKVTASSGVATFNGRSGNVLPASGDYSYSQLNGVPTSFTCTTAQISTGGSGTLTASGCTLK